MIVALAGGVGGAKLANGLAAILTPDELLVVVNTGDDFEHLGFAISPDLDTVMYTLAGRANRELGWGLAGETWNFMEALEQIGGETWFRLGDGDLATHVERSEHLRRGGTLTEVTARLGRRYGVRHAIAPMSDDRVRTFVHTDEGVLAFQDYFVRRHCEPVVTHVEYRGAATAKIGATFDRALASHDLEAIVICPSNPLLSIGPILSLPGLRARLASLEIPRIAVSPIVGGRALKGPAAKMLRELGRDPSPLTVAEMYGKVINGLIVDEADRGTLQSLAASGVSALAAQSVMKDDADQRQLARTVLEFARSMRESAAVSSTSRVR